MVDEPHFQAFPIYECGNTFSDRPANCLYLLQFGKDYLALALGVGHADVCVHILIIKSLLSGPVRLR